MTVTRKTVKLTAPLRIARRRGRRLDLERRHERAVKALLGAGYNVGEIAGLSLTASGVAALFSTKEQARIRRKIQRR